MKYLVVLISIFYGHILFAQDIVYYSSEFKSSGRDIYALDVRSGNAKKLTQKSGSGHYPHFINPKLSPDGSTLVYQADTDGHDHYAIWTMKTDGTEKKRITSGEGLYPNWSPDGKTIIFSGRRSGVWEIILVPSEGGKEQIVSKNLENGKRPGWGATCSFHPDGKSIIYSYIREKVVYSLDLSTEKIQQLTKKGNYTHPIYSNSGTAIAVNRRLSHTYDLVIISNGEEELMVRGIISYSAPDWVANDSKLLFVGSVNDNQELFIVDLKTKTETQLTKNNYFDAMPVGH
ncbi:PD40 domain-containing protein [Fulvivirga lutimaris]|uniref:PD40 domain-containing protein n=1 Tax=Fulvivirga lutimaris TaxID=1819566 RepID=UPI0012BCE84F|nr:PD40 domain-containing protein [Fulvivirga lutimaris]MTI39847.1 hypothetical protein [Fulvivirga lutimaris]